MNKPMKPTLSEETIAPELQSRYEAIGEQLRAKISSKFQASTFLAGFAITTLGIQITILWQSTKVPRLLPLSIALMLASICLYINAILKLDALTMPKRFWEEDKPERFSWKNIFKRFCKENERDEVKEPKEGEFAYLNREELWELKNRMVFYWTSLTMVATIMTAISLFLMLLPLQPKDQSARLLKETFDYATGAMLLTVVYFGGLFLVARCKFKPLIRAGD